VCYFLYIASPLTLSEVRSMLPPGLSADPLPPKVAQAFDRLGPPVATVALLLAGACSCDVLLGRDPHGHEEERQLRQRYRELGLSRDEIIVALERHRRGEHRRPVTRAERAAALAGFVAEHARNAGPTVYYLQFGILPSPHPPETMARVALSAVKADPESWLAEGHALLVTR
jgi:hypothetical protein